ncbi:MAG: 3-hydroxyacyl-ACP dehydratase [Pseudomonadales bacterium]|nr:3-hydroxyacyl-ACP dehydratase [Pseudomonadales bacterium]
MNSLRLPTPTAISRTENSCTFTLQVSDQLCFFPGHFPVHSILPGVVIIDWVMELTQQHMGLIAAIPLTMEVIKFKQLVEVNTCVELKITHHREKNKLSFILSSSVGEHSSGRIVLSEPTDV